MLTLSQTMRLDHQLYLELTGGITTSVFPEVENWLQENTDHQHVMDWMGRNFNTEYRSMVDYLFCAVFPSWRTAVRCFYESDEAEPPLRDIISVPERNYMQAKMLLAMQVAYQLHCKQRAASWRKVVAVVDELAAAA